jgi:hypothetical protein
MTFTIRPRQSLNLIIINIDFTLFTYCNVICVLFISLSTLLNGQLTFFHIFEYKARLYILTSSCKLLYSLSRLSPWAVRKASLEQSGTWTDAHLIVPTILVIMFNYGNDEICSFVIFLIPTKLFCFSMEHCQMCHIFRGIWSWIKTIKETNTN